MRAFAQIKCGRFVQDRRQDVSEIRIGFMTGHTSSELSLCMADAFWISITHASMMMSGLQRKISGKIAVEAISSQNSILIQQYCAPVLLG
jgi:hypothetical protein